MDPVHKELLILRFVRKLSAVLAAHVFAESAQPHRLIFEVFFLLRREMPSIQVVLPPVCVILIISHLEITQAQAGLCAPKVVL